MIVQIVNVSKVGIERRTVNIRFIGQFSYSDVLYTLFRKKLRKALAKCFFCFSDAPVFFLLYIHKCTPYPTHPQHCVRL